VLAITLRLPDCQAAIPTGILIVDVCKYGICHCGFTDIHGDHRELIHQYCLARQKEEISLAKQKTREEVTDSRSRGGRL